MIDKASFKFYIVPVVVIVVILVVVLVIPLGKKKTNDNSIVSPTPIAINGAPTHYLLPTLLPTLVPTNGPTPTLIPFRYTGADLIQDIPPEVEQLGKQKSELQDKTPLELPFGTLSFDYKNDIFKLNLKEPKDQSKTAFEAWRLQTSPAIPVEQFAIQ